jgi:hypothetical protein
LTKKYQFRELQQGKTLSELVSPEIDKASLIGGSLVEGEAIIDSSLLPPDSSELLQIPMAIHI